MTLAKWITVVCFLLGFGWPLLWLVALLAFEFDRGGRDVVALWLASKIDRD